jgi:hypothetical protein
MEYILIFIFGMVTTYIVIGSYVYFSKTLPCLNESPCFTPSGQAGQSEKYLSILEKNNERPWFYCFLKYNKEIAITILILMLFVMSSLFWGNK